MHPSYASYVSILCIPTHPYAFAHPTLIIRAPPHLRTLPLHQRTNAPHLLAYAPYRLRTLLAYTPYASTPCTCALPHLIHSLRCISSLTHSQMLGVITSLCPNLEQLYIWNSKMSDELLSNLAENSPKLKVCGCVGVNVCVFVYVCACMRVCGRVYVSAHELLLIFLRCLMCGTQSAVLLMPLLCNCVKIVHGRHISIL